MKTIKKTTATILMVITVLLGVFAGMPETAQAAEATDAYDAKITVLDFGNTGMAGDAVLLESDGHYILMDTGYTSNSKDHRSSAVIRYLKDHGIKNLDIYLSHYHNDHYYLMTVIMNDPYFTVGTFYLPQNGNLIKWSHPKYKGKKWYGYFTKNINGYGRSWEKHSYTEIKQVIKDRGINARYITKGAKFSVGKAQFEVLWHNQSRGISGNYKTACTKFLNNESLVTRVTVGKVRYLTCGDIESEVEKELVNKGVDIKADIVKANHHGAATSNTYSFFKKVSPTYAFGTGYHCKTTTSRSKDVGFNWAAMKPNGVLTYTIEDDVITFKGSKNMVSEKRSYRLADGTIETKTFYFAKGYKKFYKGKMIPVGASISSDKRGWSTSNGKKYYFDSDGFMVKGQFCTVDGKKYYFDLSDGHMATGWVTAADGKKYYCGSNGVVHTGWLNISGKKYYFFDDGHMQQGGNIVDPGAEYAFANDGSLQSAKFDRADAAAFRGYTGLGTIGNDTFYFENGAVQTGWKTAEDRKMYLDPARSGAAAEGITVIEEKAYCFKDFSMQTGWIKNADGTFYYSENSGVLHSGWLTLSKKVKSGKKTKTVKTKYYLDPDTKLMAAGFKEIGGKKYYFDPYSGAMVTGKKTIDGTEYVFASGGDMRQGWHTITKKVKKKKYTYKGYYMPETGQDAKDLTEIDGQVYFFDPSTTYLRTNAVVKARDGNIYATNASGIIKSGWASQKNGKTTNTYYIDPETMTAVKGYQDIDGDYYFFTKSTAILKKNAWIKDDDGTWYRANSNGMLRMGWYTESKKVKVSKKKYKTVTTKYYLLADQDVDILAEEVEANPDLPSLNIGKKPGAMATGWTMIDDEWYYFDLESGAMFTGVKTIDGVKYTFGSDGILKELPPVEFTTITVDEAASEMVPAETEVPAPEAEEPAEEDIRPEETQKPVIEAPAEEPAVNIEEPAEEPQPAQQEVPEEAPAEEPPAKEAEPAPAE